MLDHGLLGNTDIMKSLREQVRRLQGKFWVNILILGESGTGKEVVARLLHQQELVSTRPFVALNMAALPTKLFESELFGVEKGAYTDATFSRAGKAELAHKGDLFLDEIGDLETESQAKLLRFLQERTIQRLGSNLTKNVDVRVICATNKSLAHLIEHGKFRVDLLYRLADVTIYLPPLRERREDIQLLARTFFDKFRTTYKLPFPKKINEAALAKLSEYHWPGNIRQLESTIKRALIFADGIEVTDIIISEAFDRPPVLEPSTEVEKSTSVTIAVQKLEKELIEAAIIKHKGDCTAARDELCLTRATFYRKLKFLEIKPQALLASIHSVSTQSPAVFG